MKYYYKLGANASVFWDPTQAKEENQTLRVGEIKQLHPSPKVTEWSQKGGLVKLSESEAETEIKKLDASFAEQKEKANEANDKLNQVAQKEQELVEKEKALKLREDAAKGLEDELEALKTEKADLLARNKELEAGKNPDGSEKDGKDSKSGKDKK